MSLRSKEKLIELCRPWTAMKPGFQPLEDWLGTNAGTAEETRGLGFSMIAGILEK